MLILHDSMPAHRILTGSAVAFYFPSTVDRVLEYNIILVSLLFSIIFETSI